MKSTLSHIRSYIVPDRYYILLTTLFFALLGSQLLINRWLIFVFLALFLVDWKKIFAKEMLILGLFLLSSYGLYLFSNQGILYNYSSTVAVAKEAAMIFLAYLMGLSLRGFSPNNTQDEKKIFYLLYAFFITYGLGALYSYVTIPQNSGMSIAGFWIYYTVEGMPHTHPDGSYAVTIVAYFLSELIALLPLLLFGFKSFRERKFSYAELALFGALGLFSLYIAAGTGRRMSLLVIILLILYFGSVSIYYVAKNHNFRYSLAVLLGIVLMFIFGYYLMQDTYLVRRMEYGHFFFSDERVDHWLLGLKHMWQYPWGGGGDIPIRGKYDPLAHNTWINIGKSYGVMAFIASILFFVMHFKYIVRIASGEKISTFIKNLVVVLAFVLFANMMVESIFNVEKSYFFYIIFFLGFLKAYSDFSSSKPESSKNNKIQLYSGSE